MVFIFFPNAFFISSLSFSSNSRQKPGSFLVPLYYTFYAQKILILCLLSPLLETSGDSSLKATDSSISATQDGSDKQYKKVRL